MGEIGLIFAWVCLGPGQCWFPGGKYNASTKALRAKNY